MEEKRNILKGVDGKNIEVYITRTSHETAKWNCPHDMTEDCPRDEEGRCPENCPYMRISAR